MLASKSLTNLSRIPFLFKLIIIFGIVIFSILTNIVLFVNFAPSANTSSYNVTASAEKANFLKVDTNRRMSFQMISTSSKTKKKQKKFNPEGYTIFFFHGFPGSRHFRHISELSMFENDDEYNNTQMIRFDRPSIGYSSPFSASREHPRIKEVVRQASKLVKSLKMKEGNFGVLGFGFGTPYALAFAKEYNVDVTIISPMGKLFNFLKTENSVSAADDDNKPNILNMFYRYDSLKTRFFESFPSFLVKFFAQLGYICDDLRWFSFLDQTLNLFTEEEAELFSFPSTIHQKEEIQEEEEEEKKEEFRLIDEEWGEILNDTIVEMYRSGVSGMIEEFNALSSDYWNEMDLSFSMTTTKKKKKRTKTGGNEKEQQQQEEEQQKERRRKRRMKFFHGKRDVLCPSFVTNDLIEEIRKKNPNDLELEVEISETHSHFSMFMDYYNDALQFLVKKN